MRLPLRFFVAGSLAVLFASMSRPALCQLNLPGFGQKNAGSNDQKVNKLLHDNLPLVLDANTAYPTVPNEDLLGGPFLGRVLPINLDTLTKPLPPGDYVLPMTFFCSEYSIHRPGAGTAYVLAPAMGTAAKAISTLLWRGMLTGHKPQEMQSVSWAIQGSVAYDKMPPSYKRLIDELIPDMKNQVNGQAFADIEDGFQGKVNRFTRKVSEKATEGLGKVTGGRGRMDIKVDVELNESFGRLGRIGQAALDGEKLSTIVTTAYSTDEAREHALYAGQGTQAPPLPAANGPWSVIVPGVAYMRYVVHGGNLQSDNTMQIRIVRHGTQEATIGKPRLVLAQYPQSFPPAPSLTGLVGGTVNQSNLSQCFATQAQADTCTANATTITGLMAYSVGSGAQASLSALATPIRLSPSSPPTTIKITKLIYDKVYLDHSFNGLCIYLGATFVSQDGKTTSGDMSHYRWVQRLSTNVPLDRLNEEGIPTVVHDNEFGTYNEKCDTESTDPCGAPLRRPHGTTEDSPPYYRPLAFEKQWHDAYPQYGYVMRDKPSRMLNSVPNNAFIHFTTTLVKDGDFANPAATIKWGFTKKGNNDITVDPMMIAMPGKAPFEDKTVPYIFAQDRARATALCDGRQIMKYGDNIGTGRYNSPLVLTDPLDYAPPADIELRQP